MGFVARAAASGPDRVRLAPASKPRYRVVWSCARDEGDPHSTKHMKTYYTMLFLVLAACQFKPPGTIGDPALGVHATPELLEHCEQARDRWYDATGIVMSCDEGRRVLHYDRLNTRCAAGETSWDEVRIRNASDTACTGTVGKPGWPEDRQYEVGVVVAHELGHVLAGERGGRHAAGGLMARVFEYDYAAIDEHTLVWLCETAPCRWLEAE